MKQGFILILLLLTPLAVFADTLYVPDDHGTIQEAIDASINGDTVIVRPGTYVENIDFNGKEITLRSEQGPEVTIIDGNATGTVVTFSGGAGRDSVLDGFTITNGASATGGGGVSIIDASSPVIRKNIITGNTAVGEGGGVYGESGSSPKICGNIFDSNTADSWGGAIYCDESSPYICGNTITNNTGMAGGGFLLMSCESVIINNKVSGNSAASFGGGISLTTEGTTEIYPAMVIGNSITDNVCLTGGGGLHLGGSSAEVRNNIIIGNTATNRYGGGIVLTSLTDVLVANCTISDNSATLGGGAIGMVLGGNLTVIDTILWGNSAPTGKSIALVDGSSLGISYSDVDGGEGMVDVEAGSTLDWGLGNIDEDPGFVTGSDGDYYLATASPCIDAGDEASTLVGGTTSVGQAMDDGIVDMGYHYPGLARLLTGPGPAETNPPLVRLFKPECMADFTDEFYAYGASSYGVNVTCGDVDGDRHDEIITGAGPGAIYGPHVRGFTVDGSPLSGSSFLAYGTNKYGVNVAVGDLDGDGMDEIVTGAGPGAVFGPHVRAWNYDGGPAVSPISGVSYFAYGTPKWGVNVSCGDIDGDGFDEIVTGPGPGAVYGPHVRGWNVDGGTATPIPGVSFLAYGTNKFGVNVTCGDIDGDGIDEIVTGAGPGAVFGAHVRGWNVDGATATAMANLDFFAWSPDDLRYGATVFSGADLNGDGRDEIVVGQGPDPEAGSWVKVYMYDDTQATEWISLEAYGDSGLTHGANVAAGHF